VTLTLNPGQATLDQLEQIWRTGEAVVLDDSALPGIEAAAALVRKAAEGDEAVYGVNTGFGKLASVRIKPGDTAQLQRNLILSHCCGVGEPLDVATTRLMMALKLLSQGAAPPASRWKTLRVIQNMLAKASRR
jgi:histidine ammonia-lyase